MYAGAGAGHYQHPYFYRGGMGYHHPMQQYGPHYGGGSYMHEYPGSESMTETDVDNSDAEQINKGKRPNQSELSKAEMLEQAYSQQQQEML